MSETKPINKKILIGLLIIYISSYAFLENKTFGKDNSIETSLEVLFFGSILVFLFLIWKRITANTSSKLVKAIELFRIIFGTILFFSLGLLIKNGFRSQENLLLVLMILSIVSALGLAVLTVLYKSLTSDDEGFKNSKR